ncbi:translation initiation factor IF-2 [Lactonifactor sp. BIOML-A3]|uniref:translation initiation factor IF-2 n=1 Tax=Lactonifactor sp. BIOML-A3 TaxID=2584656 RepID=UPI0012B0BBBB|nr:translation initiation factor IF-2 [Lactonifactor sp. BIOML-A3]MSA12100.1 translation initiation factor IF-2 [Lactonifactor sp. BIOML-A3]
MSKIRVHELAKELDKTNKEVLDFLKEKNIEVKSHMSSLEDDHVKAVKEHFEKPKKKSNIIQVFRPQNASNGGDRRGKGPQRSSQSRPYQGRPQTEHPVHSDTEKPVQNTPASQGDSTPRPTESNVKAMSENSSRPVNNNQRPANNSQRSTGGNQRTGSSQRSGGGYQRTQGGQRPAGGYQRNNDGQRNGDGQRGTGNYQRPQGGQRPTGGYQRNNDGQRPAGGYQRSNDGQRQGGGYRSNDGQRPGGGYRSNDGQRPAGRTNDFRKNGPDTRNKPTDSKIEIVDKDSRKLNRDNKKKDVKREEYKNQGSGGKRPNQGGRRPNQRLPKALQRPNPQPKQEEKKEEIKEITLPEKMTIRELAEKMKMQPSVIVKKLFLEGILVTVNHEIDFEKAQEIALSYDIIAEPEEKIDVIEELLREEEEDNSLLVSRPPVVCVMGHVDHGKTSLLDAIRNTHVTDKEAGGITQHIGAYVVSINGQKITFLDTPGHEAFTAMRMRGANATDIAILVVAADDGVMPQTVEAINHAKAAGTEIIVAVNKIDKPSANVEKVKQELSEYELIPEDWGGSTIFVPVSAHSGDGIDELLEMILLTAEVGELKANPKRKARGLVIEAELDKGKGPVATILVQKGTLQVGDFIAAGSCSGKVRAMMDDKGRRVKEAGPSTPVEILGLSDVPNAGEILVALDNDKEAKQFAETFVSEGKNKLLEDTKAKMSLDDLFTQIKAGNLKELPIVVKADVQGSVEAVKQSLVKLSNEEVIVKVIHGGVGAINESDVTLASASNAIIIGFNVRPDATAKAIAEQEGVDLRLYRVIYQAIEDVEAAMNGMLDPVYEEKVIGHGEVRQTFKASGIGTIAGSYVLDGIFQRGCKVRITREDEQIFEGPLASLKRFKDDVKEVKAGYECGLVFQDFNDVKEEDKVEAYIMVEVPR